MSITYSQKLKNFSLKTHLIILNNVSEVSTENVDVKDFICTSHHVVCNVKPHVKSFDDIICDGKVDCFGGADESQCSTFKNREESLFETLNEKCGGKNELVSINEEINVAPVIF